jgi:hypothetical protein
MKKAQVNFNLKFTLLALLVFVFVNVLKSQTDTTKVAQTEPSKEANTDKKRKDEFKVYAGLSLNTINGSSERFTSEITPGWMLGGSYKRGKFFYWEAGLRYNNAAYDLVDKGVAIDSSNVVDGLFAVRSVDVPLSVGINVLSFVSRIVGLRIYVGATPQFAFGVGSNDLGITKSDISGFNLLGQAGLGLDVTFLYLESGVNYGFSDLFSNYDQTNPLQVFIILGFRF